MIINHKACYFYYGGEPRWERAVKNAPGGVLKNNYSAEQNDMLTAWKTAPDIVRKLFPCYIISVALRDDPEVAEGVDVIKHVANIITFLRIPLAVVMLFSPPFSALFWSFYFCGGFTDIIDGFIARKLNQESVLGAKLDSIADFIFAGAVAIFVVINIEIPIFLWRCVLCVALLRFVSYGIGFYKYRAFAPLHTYANKITGVLIFMAPIFYRVWGLVVTSLILCTMAFASALEEIIITIRSKELNRECKSVFMR